MLPPEEKGRIFYNAAMDGFNFFRNRQTISRVIEQIARYSAFESAPAVAAQSALIRSCLPRFLDENPMPLLDAVEPRIWIGNAITVPAHFDDANNIACVVAGRRRFTLFPPEQIGKSVHRSGRLRADRRADQPGRFRRAGSRTLPALCARRCAHAFSAELGPGDAIFIPPLWWHHVQSLELCNILVNYWWGASHADNAGLDCLTHALITLRQLPASQRAAWAATVRLLRVRRQRAVGRAYSRSAPRRARIAQCGVHPRAARSSRDKVEIVKRSGKSGRA